MTFDVPDMPKFENGGLMQRRTKRVSTGRWWLNIGPLYIRWGPMRLHRHESILDREAMDRFVAEAMPEIRKQRPES